VSRIRGALGCAERWVGWECAGAPPTRFPANRGRALPSRMELKRREFNSATALVVAGSPAHSHPAHRVRRRLRFAEAVNPVRPDDALRAPVGLDEVQMRQRFPERKAELM
jgi:hypothetical protein